MSNLILDPVDESIPEKKGLKVLLTGGSGKGNRAKVAMSFMAAAGILLLLFVLFATWHNGEIEPASAQINTAWAEQTFDKVLVAFLGMLAFTRERATR